MTSILHLPAWGLLGGLVCFFASGFVLGAYAAAVALSDEGEDDDGPGGSRRSAPPPPAPPGTVTSLTGPREVRRLGLDDASSSEAAPSPESLGTDSLDTLFAHLDGLDDEDWLRMLEREKLITDDHA